MNNVATSECGTSRALYAQRQALWRSQNLFIDRIYQLCNNVHPGIGMERVAVEHIQELLMRILFELLECRPQKIEDMDRCVRNSLPASMCHWVVQFQETSEALHNISTRKLHEKRNANTRSLTALIHALHPKIKEHLGYKVDEKVVLYIVSVIEYITADILKWTGNYVKNIRKGDQTIGLQNLKIALSADKSLMELTEFLFNENEEEASSTSATINQNGDENWRIAQELTYEKVSRDFSHEEEQYLRDLNLVIHVFRRRFESVFDAADKHYLEEIFGNVLEVHELTVKVHRVLEDAVEMCDTPCLGTGFWELAEAHEFDVYLTYMDLFKRPTLEVLTNLLKEPKYTKFFETEDRSYSVTPGGETFRLAVRYVLPTLLQAPLVHFFRYLEYISLLIHLAKADEDMEDLRSAKSYFSGIAVKIESLCDQALKTHLKSEQTARNLPESSRSQQLRRIQEIQRCIELWDGKEIGYTCTEVIREGDLMMVRPGMSAADSLKKGRGATDRHVFLFDHLLVLCKTQRSSKPEKPVYKYKAKALIRKTDIFDLADTDDLQNAFKVESKTPGRDRSVSVTTWVLFCKSPEEKDSWMADLVMIQTKSLLDRMLDSSLKEEEKRIPLYLPAPKQYRFAEIDSDENIVFEDYTSSSGIPVVKHGTVLKLVERLTYHLYTDNNFVRTFLTTYRSFCSPSELLQLLVERFSVPTPYQLNVVEQSTSPTQPRGLLNGPYATVHSQGLSGTISPVMWSHIEQSYQRFRKEYQRPIQCRVLSVIRQWVNGHWYDFENEPQLLASLCAFLEETDRQGRVTNQHRKWCKSIQTCVERKMRSDLQQQLQQHQQPLTPNGGDSSTVNSPLNSPTSFGPARPQIVWHSAKKGDLAAYDLLSLHPLEIGRQVTLLQFELYRAIKPVELVGSAWTKRDKDTRSPQLLKLIDHSTMLTYWVARSIVETASLEERVEMFSRVLDVMAVFEELNNFTGLVALYSALNSSSVYRLRASWERMDKEKQISYEKFKKLCNPHWKEMIERLRTINPPCVPFFGHYLSKIFFYEEGNSTFVQNNDEDLAHEQLNAEGSNAAKKVLVSFVKCRRIAAIISDIQMYQNQPYALQVEPSIRQFFETINPLNGFEGKDSLETYMWEQSLKVEPKEADKWDTVKPSRPAHVLKSPGIKPPKAFSSASSSGPSNHYGGHRSSGRGFTTAFNTYSPGMLPELFEGQRTATMSNGGPVADEKNSHLGMVEINPGQQPRYLGDARRGGGAAQPPLTPSAPRPPPLAPRLRKEKAASTPPSPLTTNGGGTAGFATATQMPPPLFPRRTSPQFFATSPRLPPSPFHAITPSGATAAAGGIGSRSGPTTPPSPPFSSAPTERMDSFVFPPSLEVANRALFTPEIAASSGGAAASSGASLPQFAPAVPPRRKGDALPPPLPPEAVRVVWSGETSPKALAVSAVLPLPPNAEGTAPPILYPRRSQQNVQPPPRPPKKQTGGDGHDSGDGSSPPPLPPKTYKRRQRQS